MKHETFLTSKMMLYIAKTTKVASLRRGKTTVLKSFFVSTKV